MCGIVGYIGNDVENVIISKLKKLEYRGYDSAGIAVGTANGYKVFKAKGEIKNLEKIGIVYINAEELVGHKLRDFKYRVSDKEHPSELFWEEITPALVKKLDL